MQLKCPAHSFGSTDINIRGEQCLNFIAETILVILKYGCRPTFQHRRGKSLREEVLNMSLGSCFALSEVEGGRVLNDDSALDHN